MNYSLTEDEDKPFVPVILTINIKTRCELRMITGIFGGVSDEYTEITNLYGQLRHQCVKQGVDL